MTLSFRIFAFVACAFLVGGFLGLSVGQRAPESATPSAELVETAESSASTLPAVAARPPESLELPALGTVIVRSGAAGISVFANEAPRFDVLIVLASSLGFELIDRTRTNPTMTLQLANLTVEEVLTRVLDDTPYRLRYAVAEDEAGVEIASLEIAAQSDDFRPQDEFDVADDDGSSEDEKPPEPEQKEVEERVARMGPRRVLDDVGRRQFEDERAARNERRRAETIDELSAVDPDTREFAASQLDAAHEEDRNYLANLLHEDQNPAVRREAALQLAFGSDREVVAALERALGDPDVGVVATTIDSLAFVGDSSAIPSLEPFLNHDNTILSGKAENAISLLSTSP